LRIMANRAMDTLAEDDPALLHSREHSHEARAREVDSREGNPSELGGAQESEGRDSGIVEVERKASAVAGGVTGALANTLTDATTDVITDVIKTSTDSARREHEIEIDTDLGEPRAQMITQTVETNGSSSAAALDEDAIQVSDDEIESAEPARPTLTSGLPAFGGSLGRRRPPAPPSMRPRPPSTSLPPPRRPLLGSSLPPPSFPSHAPSERNPWMLANKTLELSRANARISVLEDQIAFRDARILILEDRLEAAQQKIEELERKLDLTPLAVTPASVVATPTSSAAVTPTSSAAVTPTSSAAVTPASSAAVTPASSAAVTSSAAATLPSVATVKGPTGVTSVGVASANGTRNSSKPAIAIPKPADVAKAMESGRGAPARAEAAKAQASAQAAEARESLAQGASEETSDSIPPDAEEELASGAAAPSSGPDDVRQIAGIGPRFEAALRKQGITRLSQIAAWSDADVRQVAKALKIPKSRIVKGRWVEAAREMIGSRATSE
jgi:NADH-quinone oxidoreductase subunit E